MGAKTKVLCFVFYDECKTKTYLCFFMKANREVWKEEVANCWRPSIVCLSYQPLCLCPGDILVWVRSLTLLFNPLLLTQPRIFWTCLSWTCQQLATLRLRFWFRCDRSGSLKPFSPLSSADVLFMSESEHRLIFGGAWCRSADPQLKYIVSLSVAKKTNFWKSRATLRPCSCVISGPFGQRRSPVLLRTLIHICTRYVLVFRHERRVGVCLFLLSRTVPPFHRSALRMVPICCSHRDHWREK